MIDEVRDQYDELEHIIETLKDLSNDIRHYKDIAEQIDAIWCDAEKEMENVGKDLERLEEEELEELKIEYRRSVI